MSSYTLWVVSEPSGSEALLVVERPNGTLSDPFLARADGEVRRFLANTGMPGQIAANCSTAVRIVRQAEPRLFQVPATVLKPKELMDPLAALLLDAYRREAP
jgi:hypothetical protein